VVALNCPGIGYINTKATFSATITNNQTATINWYFNGALIQTNSNVTSAVYTNPGVANAGQNTIQVIATNTDGSSEASCNWVVYNPNPQYTFTGPGTQTIVQVQQWSVSDTYGHTFTENLRSLVQATISFEECQLPDGNWIYLFNMGLIGLVRDAATGLKPSLITGVDGAPPFLGGFTQFKLAITKNNPSTNNPNLVLFSSLDPYCYAISNIEGGSDSGYYNALQSSALVEGIFEDIAGAILTPFAPEGIDGYLTALAVSGDLANFLLTPTEVTNSPEQISQTFDFASPQTDVACYVRWIVWVAAGANTGVSFTINSQILQTGSLGIPNIVTITPGQSPVITGENS